MKQSTADYYNDLNRRLADDPDYLCKKLAADFARMFAALPKPAAPEPMEESEDE